jgi:hypothetical protein
VLRKSDGFGLGSYDERVAEIERSGMGLNANASLGVWKM